MKISEEIKKKAQYCLNCKNKKCQEGCPLENNIPEFINEIKKENIEKAYDILCKTTAIPAICGLICPHEKNCEAHCIRAIKQEPVKIGDLEAFVGEFANKENIKMKLKSEKKEQKIAIIGGGPSGLTAAAFLAKEGYNVTIFEKEKKLGGVLSYGIPEFRLSKELVEKSIKKIIELGIEVKTETKLGEQIALYDLQNEYDAVYLALGANIPTKMQIEGENLKNVYGANDLLRDKKHPNYKEKTVCVIGGGNVAMDIARTSKRLGAKEVLVLYRRSEIEMPANRKEIEAAKDDGVKFLFQTNILQILGKEQVEKIECIKTELVKKDGSKRLSPINIERK